MLCLISDLWSDDSCMLCSRNSLAYGLNRKKTSMKIPILIYHFDIDPSYDSDGLFKGTFTLSCNKLPRLVLTQDDFPEVGTEKKASFVIR